MFLIGLLQRGEYATPPQFICPDCTICSWHPGDRAAGWCGRCKSYTAPATNVAPTSGWYLTPEYADLREKAANMADRYAITRDTSARQLLAMLTDEGQ